MADYGELGYLMAQRRGSGNAGAEMLGNVLGGGGARSAMIFNKAANEGAQMADRLAQARQRQFDEVEKQRQRSVRHNIASRKRSEGNQDLGDFFDAYDNPEQIAQANEKLLQASAMQKNLELADAPVVDYNHLNARKIATAAGPTELVRSLGDGSYTTNAYRTDPNVQLSEVGRAFVGEKRALAGEHNAQAARATAAIGSDKAGNYEIVDTPLGKVRVNKLTNQVDQPTLNGQPLQKSPGMPQHFTQHEAVAALGGENGVPDPSRYRAFEDLKAKNPGMSDTDTLARFRQTYDDDPAAAASAGMGPSKDLAPEGPSALAKLGAMFSGTPAAKPGRKIVRTGTANGKRVVQYDDGTIEEQ